MGKYLGGLLALGASLLVALVVCLLVVSVHPGFVLTASVLGRVALVYLAALLALSCYLLLGIAVSSRTERSSTTLVILLFIWVLTVFALPRLGAYVARQAHHVEGRKSVEYAEKQILQEVADRVRDHASGIQPGRMWAAMSGIDGVGGWRMLTAGNPYPTLEYYRRYYAYSAPLYVDSAERIWDVRRRRDHGLARQQEIAEAFQLLSPAALFARASRRIAGTDVRDYRQLMGELRRFRRLFVDYLADREAFDSYAFFSLYEPSPEEGRILNATGDTFARLAQLAQKARGMDQESEEFKELLVEAGEAKRRGQEQMATGRATWEAYVADHPQQPTRVDLTGMPEFRAAEHRLDRVAAAALPALLILCTYNVLLLLLAHVAFLGGKVC